MPQTFLTPVIIFFTFIFCFAVLFIGDFKLMILGAIVPALFLAFSRPQAWAMVTIICFLSSLRVPGLPGQLQLYELAALGFCGLMLLQNITMRSSPRPTWPKAMALAFLLVIIIVIRHRGSGMRILGSDMWGGAHYVRLVVATLFFLAADQIRLNRRQWTIALVGLFVLAGVPAIGEILYRFTGGAATWQFGLIMPTGIEDISDLRTQDQILRYQSFMRFATIYLLPMLLFPFSGKYKKYYIVVVMAVLALCGLSGHRMVLIMMSLTIWLYMFFSVKNKSVFIVGSVLLVALTFLVLGQLAFLFPKSHQRMLSIIPFARVDTDVMIDAYGTVTWRLKVWKEALKLIPQYFWVGKGFAFSIDIRYSHTAMLMEEYQLWWALAQTAYHQGILSLMVGLGFPGLIAGLGFLLAVNLRHLRLMKTSWEDTKLQRMHRVMCAFFLAQAISYVFIYGDVHISFPKLFLYAGILEALRRSKMDSESAEATSLTPAPDAELNRSNRQEPLRCPV